MGMARKPNALKVLEGNVGHRPKSELVDPVKPDMTAPEPPDWLDEEAKKAWHDVSADLAYMGLLSHADGNVLTTYALAWSDLVKTTKFLNENGTTMQAPNGARNIVQRPEVMIRDRAMERVLKVAREFGLTPASRSKMAPTLAPSEQDDLSTMLGL